MIVTVDTTKSELVVRIPLIVPPSPSASGKSLLIASTRGTLTTEATIHGKVIQVSLNATIAPDKPKA